LRNLPYSRLSKRDELMETGNKHRNQSSAMRQEYRMLRQRIGSQRLVSELLGISEDTIGLRELGHTKLKLEHLCALRYIAMQVGYVVDHHLEFD
jgi:hypothetical protein